MTNTKMTDEQKEQLLKDIMALTAEQQQYILGWCAHAVASAEQKAAS